MNSNPLISVILTTYNLEEFVEESINSILNQTYTNFELLIVDDGSTDKTKEIIEDIAEKDKRIKFFSILHTGLPASVRNFGIKHSKGELIAFIDGDDLWTKRKLEDQLMRLKKNPDSVLVYSASFTFGNVNFFSPFYEVLPLPYKSVKTKEDLIQKGNAIPLSTVLVKREYIEKTAGFDEDTELKIEDYDFWLRLSEYGNFLFVPRIHLYYRIHSNQFSADWESKRKRLEYLAKKRNLNLPEYKFYRNKGIFFLLLRNTIHLLSFFWYKITGFFNGKK